MGGRHNHLGLLYLGQGILSEALLSQVENNIGKHVPTTMGSILRLLIH